MYPKIKQIIVTWRKGRGANRIPIAVVKKNESEGTTFRYIQEGVAQAQKVGFVCYPDFTDTDKTYNLNVQQILSHRLNNPERPDIDKYYDFWEIPKESRGDVYRMLVYTQGLLPTDNFEFLAQYYSVSKVKFVSEVCGFSDHPLNTGSIHEGDTLIWKLEQKNEYDCKAVALYFGIQKIGYVKRIHNEVFHLRNSKSLKIRVKKLEQNGHINKAYILIFSE